MNIRTLFLTFALLVISAICIPKLYSAEEPIAKCYDNGLCVIQEEMLNRMVWALEHWYGKAKTCKDT